MLLAKTLRSSTLKLALICIAVFGAIVVALFVSVYWSTASYVQGRSDRAIATELARLHAVYADAGRAGLIASISQAISDQRLEGGLYLLADASFASLAGNLDQWPSATADPAGWRSFTGGASSPTATHRPMLRATFATLPDGSHLLVGRDIGDLDGYLNKIKVALALSIFLIFVIAGFASISVTRRTVGRIESVNATSRAIMQSGLGRRIPLRGTRDEWDELATNLNSMLERIEALMGEVKQVTDNVAHDLRTPLTRIRARLEKASTRPREAECDQSLIGDTMADLDAVLGTFSSLMRISQIEGNDRTAAFLTVDLSALAREVVELFDAAAEEKGGHIEVRAERRVPIVGDRDLLFDALANLVDNAIKHGRDAGRVIVGVLERDGQPVVSVLDDGPGIPEAEHHHVFKRFYRLDRNRRTPGNGLGLSLVGAVARLHGARIEMLNKTPGFELRLWFPPAIRSPGQATDSAPTAAQLA